MPMTISIGFCVCLHGWNQPENLGCLQCSTGFSRAKRTLDCATLNEHKIAKIDEGPFFGILC